VRWLFALALAWGSAYAQRLELHFIDVGQGDAALIRSPSGQNVLNLTGGWKTSLNWTGAGLQIFTPRQHQRDTLRSVTTFGPETIVISVGEGNTYGHPEPETLALYQSISADIYRTDQSGTVIVSATADGQYTVNAQPSAAPEVIPTEPLEADPEQTTAFDPTGEEKDCGDFSSQAEAQAFYEAAGGPGEDPHRLDSEGDGVACESLP